MSTGTDNITYSLQEVWDLASRTMTTLQEVQDLVAGNGMTCRKCGIQHPDVGSAGFSGGE